MVNQTPIKAIIFDIGGVIIQEPSKDQHETISKKFGLDSEKFRELRRKHIWKTLKNKRYLKNKKCLFEYEILIAKTLKVNPNEFIDCWQKLREKEMNISPETKRLLKKLSKNYLLGTLTNVSPAHEILRKKKNVYDSFKINIKSCELGICKPDKKFFKVLLKELKREDIKPEEVIFIDDRSNNISAAKELGINAILFKNNKSLIKDLRKFGVKITW
jgi:epoxide hydrolase-like predicted phosphatase